MMVILHLFFICRERELEFVQSLNTTGDFESWLEFNLTSALSTWVTFPESNKGLYLSVHAADKPGKLNN